MDGFCKIWLFLSNMLQLVIIVELFPYEKIERFAKKVQKF